MQGKAQVRADFRRSIMQAYSGDEISGRTLYIEMFGFALKITLARK